MDKRPEGKPFAEVDDDTIYVGVWDKTDRYGPCIYWTDGTRSAVEEYPSLNKAMRIFAQGIEDRLDNGGMYSRVVPL